MPHSFENRKHYTRRSPVKFHKHHRVSRSRSRDFSYRNKHHHKDFRKKYYHPKRASYSSDSDGYSPSRSYSDSRSRSPSYRHHKYYNDHKKNKKYHKSKDKFDHKHHQKKKKQDYYEKDSTPKHKKSSSVSESGSKDEDGKGKDAGHYKYKVGQIVKRYKVIQHLGDGTFGRCLEVKDIDTNKIFAMKVIRAVDRYIESAKTEAEILSYIAKHDPDDKHGLVRMETSFENGENYFMVFEKLGMSLYDFLKKNNYRGFTINFVQSFAKQILTAISFLHSIGLTHTDLKPENVLLVNDECIPIKYAVAKGESPHLARSSTCSKSEEKIYYKPRYEKIKLIDFGGATYDHEHHSSIINTRQYRAPEVILGCCQWDHESDLWSIACILLELYSGDLFFETHESYEHLALIEKAVGSIPFWMANRCNNEMKKHFHCDDDFYEKNGSYYDWPRYASSEDSVSHVKNMKLITDIVPAEYSDFIDLLKRMLTIDPDKRIKAKEALEHPFFKKDYSQIAQDYDIREKLAE